MNRILLVVSTPRLLSRSVRWLRAVPRCARLWERTPVANASPPMARTILPRCCWMCGRSRVRRGTQCRWLWPEEPEPSLGSCLWNANLARPYAPRPRIALHPKAQVWRCTSTPSACGDFLSVDLALCFFHFYLFDQYNKHNHVQPVFCLEMVDVKKTCVQPRLGFARVGLTSRFERQVFSVVFLYTRCSEQG